MPDKCTWYWRRPPDPHCIRCLDPKNEHSMVDTKCNLIFRQRVLCCKFPRTCVLKKNPTENTRCINGLNQDDTTIICNTHFERSDSCKWVRPENYYEMCFLCGLEGKYTSIESSSFWDPVAEYNLTMGSIAGFGRHPICKDGCLPCKESGCGTTSCRCNAPQIRCINGTDPNNRTKKTHWFCETHLPNFLLRQNYMSL